MSSLHASRGQLRWLVDLSLVGVAITWGLNHVVVKHLLSSLQPLAFNTVRLVLSSAILLLVLWAVERDLRLAPGDLWPAVGLGLLGHTLYQTLFITGINITSAGKTAVILAASPACVACLEQLTGRERYSWRAWAGVLSSLLGVLLVAGMGGGGLGVGGPQTRGDLLILGATVCWAGYTVGARPLLVRYSALRVTTITMALGTVPLVAVAAPAVLREEWGAVTPSSWGALVFSFLLPLVVGYSVWSWGIKRIGSGRTAIYANLCPLVASVVGWLALGEKWSAAQVLGAVLILAGISQVRHLGRTVADGSCSGRTAADGW